MTDKSLTLPRKWLRCQWVEGFCTRKDSDGKSIFSTSAIDEPDLYLWIKDVHYPQVTTKQYRTALRDLCKEKIPGYKESPLSAELRGLLNTRIKEIGKRLWAHQKTSSKVVPGVAAVAAWEKIDEGTMSPANAKKSLDQDEISISNHNPYEPVFGDSYSSSNVDQHQQAINSSEIECGGSFSNSSHNVQQQQTIPTTSTVTNTTNSHEQECGGNYSNSIPNVQQQQSNLVHVRSALSITTNADHQVCDDIYRNPNACAQHQQSKNVYTTYEHGSSNAKYMTGSVKPWRPSPTTQQELGHVSMPIQVGMNMKGYPFPDNSLSCYDQVIGDNCNGFPDSSSTKSTNSAHLSLSKQVNVSTNDHGFTYNTLEEDRARSRNNNYINISNINNNSSTHIPRINNQLEYSSQCLNSHPNSSNTNNQHCSQANLMRTRRLHNSSFGMEISAEPLPKRLALARVYVENRDGPIDFRSRSDADQQTRDELMMAEPNDHVVSSVTSSAVCMSVPTVGIQTPAVAHAFVRPEFGVSRFDNLDRDADIDNDVYISTKKRTTPSTHNPPFAARPEFDILHNDSRESEVENDDNDSDDIDNDDNDNDDDNDDDDNNFIAVDIQTTTSTLNMSAATSLTALGANVAPPVASTVTQHGFDAIRGDEQDSDDDDDDDDDDMAFENLPFRFAEDEFFVPLASEEMKEVFNEVHAGLSDFGLVSKSDYCAMEKHYTSCFSDPSVVGFSVHIMTIHTTGRLNSYVNQTFTDFIGKNLTKEAHVIVDHSTTLRGLSLISDDNAADVLNVPSAWIDCFDESGKPIKKHADVWFPNIKYNVDEAVLMFTPHNSATLLRQPGPYLQTS